MHLNIVCADDAYLNLEALGAVLKNLGLLQHSLFMENGGKVVDHCIKSFKDPALRQRLVQIVIVDYMMPGMTGIQAIEEVRAFYSQMNMRAQRRAEIEDPQERPYPNEKFTPPVFVMFSVHQHLGFREFAKDHGVDYFISKPPKQQEI